jgi:hypothetical protein
MIPDATEVRTTILRTVETRTSRHVRDLVVEVDGDYVKLGGRATTFHAKQLAQHGVWEVFPGARLANEIIVD